MFRANKSPSLRCRNIARPLWSPCSSCRGYKNLPHIFRCLYRNQSLVRCGGLFLRTALAILRLITWQLLWGPRGSASPAGFNKSLTPYTRCRLCSDEQYIRLLSHVTISHQLGLTRTRDKLWAFRSLHNCFKLISALLFSFVPPSCFLHIAKSAFHKGQSYD